MEQRKAIVSDYSYKGLIVNKAVAIAGLNRSTYYYRSNGKPKGKSCSTHTRKVDGSIVSNDLVIQEIISIISPEYHDYGYDIVTHLLKEQGYIINHKKVYRLMREHNLLHPSYRKSNGVIRDRIKYTVPILERPFATIEADIKYIYIHGENRNAYLITFLCTFCGFALVWDMDYSMRANQVANLVDDLVGHPLMKKYSNNQSFSVIIRTDNGPQFIAKKLAESISKKGIKHEFIHPATPQENGHIEGFHSIVTSLICNKNIFSDLNHALKIFQEFFLAYNYTRVKKRLLYKSPFDFLKLWESGVIGIKRDKHNKEIFFFKEKPASKLETGFSYEEFISHNKSSIFENNYSNHLEISPV